MPILEIEDLSVSYLQYESGLKQTHMQVIHHLDLAVHEGEVLAVVGSSGSGKTLLAHAVLGLLPRNAIIEGTIKYAGTPLTDERQAALRGKEIALIPQSVSFLDPLMTVAAQVRTSVRKGEPKTTQRKWFKRFQLGPEVERQYPFQLSGGMARRTLVSMATVSGAKVLIADEPTPGMDSSNLKEALDTFRHLAHEGCAVMIITHDLMSILDIADRIAVLYAGTLVEIASADDFTHHGEALRHPYTQALWRAQPQNGFNPIPGSQPQFSALPQGCSFAPRCERVTPECSFQQPDWLTLRDGKVKCIHAT